MDDHIGLFFEHQFAQRVKILEHPDMRFEMLVLEQHLMATLFDAHVIIVGHPVETDDGKTLFQKQHRQMETDKTG
jgi:hypothetical protein